ncbi:MAG: ABC transporter permease [Armatimonadetes bacterium]|nr:ABC transporter permease [Armatimonadota bacterium]
MIWNAIDFVCRETALHLQRERLIAIATISTVAVLMLVLGSMVLFLLDVKTWTQRIGDELEVCAYFEREYPREKAEEAAKEVAEWPLVNSASLVTKEEGWERLRSTLASGDRLRDLENPLVDCIRAQARDPEDIAEIAADMEKIEGVRDVIPSSGEAQGEDSFAHKVVQAKRIIAGAGTVIGILVALAGIFIIHNTIRLALHSRWREIYIMQLIGATRAVIAAPFMLEGMIHGGLGAILACCLLVPTHMYLRTLSARSAPFVLLAPDSTLLPFALCLILAGAALGLTGSAFSVRRYLRKRPEWHS